MSADDGSAGGGTHGIDVGGDGLDGFFQVQVFSPTDFRAGLSYPSAFLVLAIIDTHEIDKVQVHGLSVCIHCPCDVNTACFDVAVGGIVSITIAECRKHPIFLSSRPVVDCIHG